MGIESALIIASGALGAALINSYKEELKNILSKAERPVEGVWEGTGGDIEVPGHLSYEKKLTYEVKATLKQRGGLFFGNAFITGSNDQEPNEGRTFEVGLKGCFVNHDLIEINYKVIDGNVNHSGIFFLEILGIGTKMKGFFLAKIIYENNIGFGALELDKN
jgi:hypothetical protein